MAIPLRLTSDGRVEVDAHLISTRHRARGSVAFVIDTGSHGAWKKLTPQERQAYNRAARRMSGYNLFIKRYLRNGGRPAARSSSGSMGDGEPARDGKQPEEL